MSKVIPMFLSLTMERIKLSSLMLGRKREEQVWVYHKHDCKGVRFQMSVGHPCGNAYQAG